MHAVRAEARLVLGGQLERLGRVRTEQVAKDPAGLVGHAHHPPVAVHVGEEEGLQLADLSAHLIRIRNQPVADAANVLEGAHPARLNAVQGRHHEVVEAAVDDLGDDLAAKHGVLARAFPKHRLVGGAEDGDGADLLDREHDRIEAVVDVVIVVGDLVHEIDELRLEGGRLAARVLFGRLRIRVGLMLDDALAHFPGEIQARIVGRASFEGLQHAKGLTIVLEAAVILHQLGHHPFAGVAERRVPEIVAEHQGLDQLFIKSEDPGGGASDLCAFEAVGEAGPVVVTLVVHEHLRLVLEAPEGRGVDDPIAVALEAGAQRMLQLGVAASPARGALHRPRREALRFPTFLRDAIDEGHDAKILVLTRYGVGDKPEPT